MVVAAGSVGRAAVAPLPGPDGARTAIQMRPLATARLSAPNVSRSTPTGSTSRVLAPMLTSAVTDRPASAFMTTTAQRPPLGLQVTDCVPDPLAVAAQKVCVAGIAGGVGPPRWAARYVNGAAETSLTTVCALAAR